MVSTGDVIILSDAESDDISFLGAGPSRRPAPRIIQPIPTVYIDSDSEDDAFPNLPSDLWRPDRDHGIEVLEVISPVKSSRGKGKGKAKASPYPLVGTSILDALDEDEARSLSLEDIPLSARIEARKSEKKRSDLEKVPDGVEQGKVKKKRKSEGDDGLQVISKEEREASKAKDKAEKQLAKDAVKAAKEAEKSFAKKLVEVNKLRTSKNDTIREIHLYLSHDLSLPSSPIAGAVPEITARVKDNLSELHYLDEGDSPIPGVIKFKRHLKARWDQATKRFIPLDEPKWVWEGAVLVITTADEIVDKIAHGQGMLLTWAEDLRLALGLGERDQVVIIIKGLQKFYAKTKVMQNREFTAAARAGIAGGAGSFGDAVAGRPSKQDVERCMVELQVGQGMFIVHVEKTEDIEEWIWNLSADIALRPYKLLSKSHLNFAPSDHPRKASTPTDALELMLQEVQGITPSAAAGIAAVYPTFAELMRSFEKAEKRGGVERAEGLLADCDIKNLRNGTANGRKLNKALAKRVYNVFRGEDSLALA